MYFETRSIWKDNDPVLCLAGDLKDPVSYWRIVEMQLAIFYYHVHIRPKAKRNGDSELATTMLCGDIEDALKLLQEYPGSTLFLQTPAFLNNGVPGFTKIVGIYRSINPVARPFIVKDTDNKFIILSVDIDSQSLDPIAVEKAVLWTMAS